MQILIISYIHKFLQWMQYMKNIFFFLAFDETFTTV